MTNNTVIRGKAALKNVSDAIPNEATLKELVKAKDATASPTSCAVTASILGDLISTKPIVAAQGMHGKTGPQKVALIAELLASPNMVAVSITPDHHFIVLPVDVDKVVILQGFQDIYTFSDWYTKRGQGIIRKDDFINAMNKLVSEDEGEKLLAAADLFSYKLATDDPVVAQKISEYFQNKPVPIVSIAHKVL